MLFNIIPKELIARTNESEMVVYLKNGSIYQLKGADDPEALRGPNPMGVVLDEFATMKKAAWEIVEPILRANGGWCWFIGTPKGKNHLYDFYQRGLKGDSEWKSWLLKASSSGIIPLDQLAKSRETSMPAHWNQEYECEFLEGEGSVFRGVRDIMTAKPKKPEAGHLYVMGVDLAKVQDWTVIRVYDRETNAQVFSDRFQTIEWPFQKAKIQAIAQHYNRAAVALDATGLGDPIADDLIRAGVVVDPIKISEQTKKDIIEKLSIWIEQKKIRLLPSEDTAVEYDNFSYEIGPTGKIRYGARSGYHDDIVIADALAVWSLQPLYREQAVKPLTPLQKHYAVGMAQFNSDEFEEGREWSEWEQA